MIIFDLIMKELSIEEKAKRYDEAVNEIKNLRDMLLEEGVINKNGVIYENFNRIFPELKESEDERIRKELISLVTWSTSYSASGVTKEDADNLIAWLEKQGEQKSIWHNEDEEPQRGSLILLVMQSGTPIVAKIIEPNHTFNHGERWAYIDDLLEKQDEQKPAVETKLKIEKDKWYICIRELYDAYNNRIFTKGNIYHSTKDETLMPDNSNVPYEIKYCPDHYFCLWTIQDAKAGDGVVHHLEKCGVAGVHYTDPIGASMAYYMSPEGLSAGDKVKIIVIKED